MNGIFKKLKYFPGMAIQQRTQGWTYFLLTQNEDYKFELGY